jgi:LuxR family maltose regulon positive regulatory protein
VSSRSRGLLPTKLHPRQTRPLTVTRPRLLELFERCAALPLTVVLGPAGAGKSTAAVAWLAHTRHAVAWLSLDAADDSPGRFFAYVLAALQTVEPTLGGDASALLAAPEPDDLELLLADEIVIPLATRELPLVLVLDDYHALADARIHAAMTWLLEHAPACLRLLLLSRSAPDLPLARLRAGGALGEIGVEQLRFALDESRRFYADVMGLALAPEAVAALEQRTEGWPAGAQLAALSLSLRGERGALAQPAGDALPGGDDRLISDYLLREVFDGLTGSTRELLLSTAMLERVCAPLAAAVSGDEQARVGLESIERANLFLIPLDSHGRWFRYHHLFRDFLREQASTRGPAWSAELHRRAATWLATRDHRQEAFEHAVASGDEGLMLELFERWAAETLERNQTGEVRRWLAKLPAALREREAATWFIDGWCDIVVGRLRTGMDKLARARAVHEHRRASPNIELLMVWLGTVLRIAALQRSGRDEEALQLSRQTRAALEPPEDAMRGYAISGYLTQEALVHLERDELEPARVLLERAAELVRGHDGLSALTLAHLAHLHRRQGRLDEAERCARRALRCAEHSASAELASGGLARVELAWVALDRGDAALALGEVEAGFERLKLLRDVAYLAHASELLARAKAASGQREDALEVIDETLELLEDTDLLPAIARMQALRGQLGQGGGGLAAVRVEEDLTASASKLEELTARELEVLQLAATGLSNREIAKRIYVSVGTVKTHMHRILAKLDAPNRTRAVHRARAVGLLG